MHRRGAGEREILSSTLTALAPFVEIICMEFNVARSIEILSATPGTLQSLLGNLSEEWTTSSGIEAKRKAEIWSPYDIIGHLLHADETDWIPRARIILGRGDDLTFVPFDRFAQFENSKGKSLAQLLDEFGRLRTENIGILRAWNLTDAQLDLEGVHPELSRVTLRQLLATWVVHDLNHVHQVATSIAKRYEAEVGPWKEYLSILSP
jgi:hypothetical protein